MSPLRVRMIEDMKLAGLSPGTQATYIDAVRNHTIKVVSLQLLAGRFGVVLLLKAC